MNLLAPFFAWSLTLVPRSLLLNHTETLATQVTFDMEIFFYSHANKTHFHKKGCALGLILKVRVFETRKWPILLNFAEKFSFVFVYGNV